MFKTIADILENPTFQAKVEEGVKKLRISRSSRPAPKPGFRYLRNYYDRMNEAGQMTGKFFLDNIGYIWTKQSSLPSETRQVIEAVCNHALQETVKEKQPQEVEK